MTAPSKAVEVYYAYAPEDENLLNRLEKHLSSLRRQGFITEWHPHKIIAGTNVAQAINSHLNTASIILLLVSPDFLHSDYCNGIEVKRAMERHAAKEAHVIPILLRPVDYEGAPFAALRFLPTNDKAITSWRNRDEAFLNITKDIRTAIEDWTTPSVSPPSTLHQYWYMPYRRNPYFIGQEYTLTHLHNTLRSEKTASLTQSSIPQALSGLGGIGKTQIALEYAYRYRHEYQALFWATADSHESIARDFVALASLLHLPEQGAQDQTIMIEAVKHWLDTHDQWLLIFDNADDVAVIDAFLPSLRTGCILLTTRANALGTRGQSIEVKQMEQAEGTLFLLRRARLLALDSPLEHASQSDCTHAEELVRTLDRLPLAIDQAGAYIEEIGCGIAGYLERYRRHRTTLLHRRGTLTIYHPEPVATTWFLSFDKVTQLNPMSACLLQYCAFLHPDAIPEELLMEEASTHEPTMLAKDLITLDEAMETLRAYSLIRRHPESNTLSIHRLVQAVLRDTMHEEQQCQWTERVVHTIDHVFPSGEPTTWSLCERYILHAQTCAAFIGQWKITIPEATSVLHKASNYLKERSQYSEAISLMQLALSISEKVFGPGHLFTASALNKVAYLYKAQGKYAEAEPLYQRALSIRKQVLGLNHSDTAASLNNLAELYRSQGKYNDAVLLLQQALNINEQVFSSNHLQTAINLNNLAYHYINQGKYADAEPLLLHALSTCIQLFGFFHPYTAVIFNSLAYLYKTQGKYDKAKPLYQRALAINEQVLGSNHTHTASALNNLAELYKAQGKYDEAEPIYQRALSIDEQVLGLIHPDTATSISNLADLYQAQGKYAEAELLFQRALSIDEQALGPNHPSTVTIKEKYTVLLQIQRSEEQPSR